MSTDAPSHTPYSDSFVSARLDTLHLEELTIAAKELFELLMLINPRMIKKNPTCKVPNKIRLTLVSDKIRDRLAGKTARSQKNK